jgi:hypothetical protein
MPRRLLFFCLAATLGAANKPIGTVTAARSVTVNAVDISTQGVPTWPLVNGDQVKTAGDQAMVTLTDGSHFLMEPNSTLRVLNCSRVEVEVVQGSVGYRFSPNSRAQMCVGGHPVVAKPLTSGTAKVEPDGRATVQTPDLQTVTVGTQACSCQNKKPITPVLLIAGAAAAALALGLALSLPSSSSPSTP